MSSVYMTSLTGAGTSMDPVHPVGFGSLADGSFVPYTTLMIDAVKSTNCLVLSDRDGVANSTNGVQLVAQSAPTRQQLAMLLQSSVLSQADRNQCNQFQGHGNQNPIPDTVSTWWEALDAMARNLNPALNLNFLFGV